MTNFDDLFNQMQNEVLATIVKDSKVILVNEYDDNHPLKLGEFWYDNDENILYVGAGDLINSGIFYLGQLLKHAVSYKHIEAPRIRTNHRIELEIPTLSSSFLYVPANRIRINHTPNFNLTHAVTTIRKTKRTCVTVNGVRNYNVAHDCDIKEV